MIPFFSLSLSKKQVLKDFVKQWQTLKFNIGIIPFLNNFMFNDFSFLIYTDWFSYLTLKLLKSECL